MGQPEITILVLFSNPIDTAQLRLADEMRDIKAELSRTQYRDHFKLEFQPATRVKDLALALVETQPTIVHFSGHGAGQEGLVLQDDQGQAQWVSTSSLVELFRQHRNTVKCVFLNACYSEVQAEAIYQQIDCVVGMNKPIGDSTAIRFAPMFYAALGWGRSFQEAFEVAQNDLQLGSNPQATIPVLKIRQNAANLSFTSAQPVVETVTSSMPHPQPSQQPQAQQSQSFGNVTINGENTSFAPVQAGNHATVSQDNSRQSMVFNNSTVTGQVGQAKGDLIQTQYLTQNEDKKPSTEEVIQLIREIEGLLKASSLPDGQKNTAITYVEAAKNQAAEKEPNKEFAAMSLQMASKIVKETNETVDAGKNLWENVQPILTNLLPWLGVASHFFGI